MITIRALDDTKTFHEVTKFLHNKYKIDPEAHFEIQMYTEYPTENEYTPTQG